MERNKEIIESWLYQQNEFINNNVKYNYQIATHQTTEMEGFKIYNLKLKHKSLFALKVVALRFANPNSYLTLKLQFIDLKSFRQPKLLRLAC